MIHTAQVGTRSNSDLVTVDMIMHDTRLAAVDRMALIATVVDGWRASVRDTGAGQRAVRAADVTEYFNRRRNA